MGIYTQRDTKQVVTLAGQQGRPQRSGPGRVLPQQPRVAALYARQPHPGLDLLGRLGLPQGHASAILLPLQPGVHLVGLHHQHVPKQASSALKRLHYLHCCVNATLCWT